MPHEWHPVWCSVHMSSLEAVLAENVDRELHAHAAAVIERVRGHVPALFEDPVSADLALAGTEALLRAFAVVLRLGLDHSFHAPPAAVAWAQHVARAGLPLADVLRSYRVGQEATFHIASELVKGSDEPDSTAAVTRVGLLTFQFADAMMADVAAAFEEERERLVVRSMAQRDAMIGQLLSGSAVDTNKAEHVLGYRLDAVHQCVVTWAATGDGEAIDLGRLLRDAGLGRALVAGPAAWVAVAPGGTMPWQALGDALTAADARVAIGTPRPGPRGFAETHHQARLAAGVARLAPGAAIVRYEDVALQALLTRDPAAARRYAAEELGPLADAGEAAETLRLTVATYFGCGQDVSRTARELGVHRNTVSRRLAGAEDLLGRPLGSRARELDVALAIAAVLGAGAA